MFDVINPEGERLARFDTLEAAGRFIASVHVACRILPTPARYDLLMAARDQLRLAETTFRSRHPAGFTPLGPARYAKEVRP